MVNGLSTVCLFLLPVAVAGCAVQAGPDAADTPTADVVGEAQQALKTDGCPVDVPIADTQTAAPWAFGGSCDTDQTDLEAQYATDIGTDFETQCLLYCTSNGNLPACANYTVSHYTPGETGGWAFPLNALPDNVAFSASCYNRTLVYPSAYQFVAGPGNSYPSDFGHRWLAECQCSTSSITIK
jgi:hypothetical protein